MAMLEIKADKEYVDTDDICYVVDLNPGTESLMLILVLESPFSPHVRYIAETKEEKQALLQRFPKPEC